MRVTGLDILARNFSKASPTLQSEIKKALGRSLAIAESEAKSRTPVDQGILKASIAGGGGFRFIENLRAGMGTNLSYAYWVEVRKDVRHTTGSWGYMQKGAAAAAPFIKETMQSALDDFGKRMVK